ncbi:hypothetical protein [Pseudoalteromonas rubra]|uniref:hypothetical protein n=1 Tax=Pseudoalteromonas rubra TaxID=43658 RepID=UPI0014869B26
MLAIEALLDSNQLSLTKPDRNMKRLVAAKRNIKRLDRLLGYTAMHKGQLTICRCCT